jgi:hypothetical protein
MIFRIAISLCSLVIAFAGASERSFAAPAKSPAIGIETGQKAPAFSSADQFGNQQSLESLKGSGGTVLLFFRSADW